METTKMSQQFLASDYDKTLYRKTMEGDLSKNLRAVQKWRDKGHLFVVSTGRDAASILHEREIRGLDYDYLVSLNGSFIVDRNRQVLFKQALEPSLAKEIATMLQQSFGDELIVSNGFDGCNFTNRQNSKNDPVAREIFERNSKIYTKSIEQALDGEVLLLGCMSDSFEAAKAFRDEVLSRFADKVEVFINLHYINIVPKGISKASGIEFLAEKVGMDKSEVLTIGDDLNDIPMLERFNGFAVENAKQEVKDIAIKIYPGVAELIEEKL